jgi:hypothetical protein
LVAGLEGGRGEREVAPEHPFVAFLPAAAPAIGIISPKSRHAPASAMLRFWLER